MKSIPTLSKPMQEKKKPGFLLKRSRGVWLAALVLVLGLSCVTMAPERPEIHWLGYLPENSQIFLDVRPSLAEEFFNKAFEESSLLSVFQRSSRILMGVRVDPQAGLLLDGVLLGDFPLGLGSFYLDSLEGYEKLSGFPVQWSSDMGLFVTIVEDGVVAVSTKQFNQPAGQILREQGVRPDFDGSLPMSISLPSPGRSFFGENGQRFLPITEARLIFENNQETSSLSGTLEVKVDQETTERIAVVLSKLFWRALKASLLGDIEMGTPVFSSMTGGARAKGWNMDPSGIQTILDALFSEEE